MGVFEQFPYVNMHEMNTQWLLEKMKELDKAMETFKATESLKFADPIIWNITTQYEKSTIVLDPTGNAYLSLQAVPTGVQLNNDEYWLEIFNFTDYTRTANHNLTINTETNTTRATADYQVDDWLIWNDVLYRVTSAIAIDDALIVAPAAGSNIVHFTVEDFIKAFITWASNTIIQYKNDIDASELQYKNDIDASELAYRNQLAQDITNTTSSLQAQLNLAISGATVDSEVINARLGQDGVTYSTLGAAIRTQIAHVINNHNRLAANLDSNYDNNLLFGQKINFGGYFDSGTLTSNADWGYTDLIPIDASTGYTVTDNCGGSFVTCWDADGNYINRKTISPPGAVTFTTPSNCTHIRFSQHKNYFDNNCAIYKSNSGYINYGKRAYDKLHYENYNPAFGSNIELYGTYGSGFLSDLDNAQDNCTYIIQRNNNLTIANFPSDFPTNGDLTILSTYGKAYYTGNNWQKVQVLTVLKNNETWYRIGQNGPIWYSWHKVNGNVIEIGPDKPYTTLRSGFDAAWVYPNAKVYVYPGTYDLVSEFSDLINSSMSGTGLKLGNGMHVLFYPGAKVTANFDNSGGTYDAATWAAIYDHFEPFRAGEGDFILEGADIEATDTRYCVHDEMYSQGIYKHVFKDCKMKYTNTHSPVKYVTCIGGGLGVHGTIEIIGGHYESVPNGCYSYITNNDPAYCQQCISYHNASGNSGSKITIKDVYLQNNGYFRFGWYGSGGNITPIYISNCHEGLATLIKREASNYNTNNMKLYEWNEDVQTESHWVLSNSNLDATLILD